MIMNELNTNLIEAAKEKFPLHFRKQPLFQKNWGYPWTELPELASATMQCSISM